MSDLPPGWALCTLGHVTSRPSVVDWQSWPSLTFEYIDIGSIDNVRARIASAKKIQVAAAPSRARQVVKSGDTIFSTVRTYLRNIGYVDDSLDGQIASTGFSVLRPAPGIYPRCVYYFTQLPEFVRDISAQQRGVNYPAVTDTQVRDMTIPIAPPAEQERIVAAIEEQFSRLDAGDAALKRARRRAEELQSRAILETLTGIGPRKRLGEVAEVRLGRQRSPANHQGPHMRPYLRAANVTWGGLDLSDVKQMNFTPAELKVYALQTGDVLLSEASGSASEVGKPAIWDGSIPDCCFQNTLLRVRSVQLISDYLYFYFLGFARNGTFSRASKGVGIHHLSKAGLAGLEIEVPSIETQQAVTQTLLNQQDQIARVTAAVKTQQTRADRLRSAILATAFSGKLVPQDSTDEPAAILLERIIADRSSSSGRTPTRKPRQERFAL